MTLITDITQECINTGQLIQWLLTHDEKDTPFVVALKASAASFDDYVAEHVAECHECGRTIKFLTVEEADALADRLGVYQSIRLATWSGIADIADSI